MSKLNDHDLSEKFMQMLFVVHYHFFRQTAFPIPASHFGTLLVLSDLGPATISDISTCLHMSKQQMTPIINRLAKDGFITKAISPEDRRYTNISLTPKGQELLDGHSENIRKRFEQGALHLSPDEIERFTTSLDTFVSSIERMYHSAIEKKSP